MSTTRVVVTKVEVLAYASLGYGEGIDKEGNLVYFVGDHRPMRHIGEALEAGEEVEVDLEPYQIQRLYRLSEGSNGKLRTEEETEGQGDEA